MLLVKDALKKSFLTARTFLQIACLHARRANLCL